MKREVCYNGVCYTYSDTWATSGRLVRLWCANALVLVVLSETGHVVDTHLVGYN